MTYIVNKTDGSVLATILDGTTNTDTGLTLIGRNYTSYGEIQNENFVKLLENFASTLPPGQSVGFTPIPGQLWWDTSNQKLRVYNGTEFVNVSEQAIGPTAPTAPKIGDQWWDTVNKQLKIYDGLIWSLIGPPYTASQGKSGAIVEQITDLNTISHTVVNHYTNGNLISVTSFDPAFETALTNFTNIRPGINLASNVVLNGLVTNSERLGGIFANAYARVDINSAFAGDVWVNGNLKLTNANISYTGTTLNLRNTQPAGNVDVVVNVPIIGTSTGLRISGSDGLVTVAGDPTNAMGIATKNYVDNVRANLIAGYSSIDSGLTASITTLRNDTDANLAIAVASQNANLLAVQSGINANVTAANLSIANLTASTTANAIQQQNSISVLTNFVASKANLTSPRFTGNPQVSTVIPEMVDYLTGLPAFLKPYRLNFSDFGFGDNTGNVTVNEGDFITRIYAANLVPVPGVNLRVRSSSTGSSAEVSIISGSLTPGIQPIDTLVVVNGVTVVPATHIPTIDFLGPDLQYIGLGNNSSTISTTSYVDVTANILYQDYNTKINNLAGSTDGLLNSLLALKANINSPTLTGTPQLSSSPPSGDNSTRIATTAFVTGAIETQKFRYTVSTSGPSGGNNGDFWFQVG